MSHIHPTKAYRPIAYILAVTLFLLSPAVSAAPIPADITIAGQYLFDEDIFETFVFGTATQSGTMFARIGGVDTTVEYDDDVVTMGTNPIAAVFTEHGDGVVQAGDGFGGTAGGSAPDAPQPEGSGYRADTDQSPDQGVIPMVVINSSLTNKYQIFMSLSVDHFVTSMGIMGDDAFARSDVEVDLNGNDVIDAEIISDTLFGNELNGIPTGGFGGDVSDTDTILFDFVLSPGSLASMELDFTHEGGAFDPGTASASGSAEYFLSIDNVLLIPEPASAVLLVLSGLGSLRVRRRE